MCRAAAGGTREQLVISCVDRYNGTYLVLYQIHSHTCMYRVCGTAGSPVSPLDTLYMYVQSVKYIGRRPVNIIT